MIRISEDKTDYIAVRANCTDSYSAAAFAVIHLSEDFVKALQERTNQTIRSAKDGVEHINWAGNTEALQGFFMAYTTKHDETEEEQDALLDEIKEEVEEADMCFISGWEEDVLGEPDDTVTGLALCTDNNGYFWFEGYGKYDNNYYSTETINVNVILSLIGTDAIEAEDPLTELETLQKELDGYKEAYLTEVQARVEKAKVLAHIQKIIKISPAGAVHDKRLIDEISDLAARFGDKTDSTVLFQMNSTAQARELVSQFRHSYAAEYDATRQYARNEGYENLYVADFHYDEAHSVITAAPEKD
jgi:hypothetical protein